MPESHQLNKNKTSENPCSIINKRNHPAMTKLYFISILTLTSLLNTLHAQETGNPAGDHQSIKPVNNVLTRSILSASYDTAYCYITMDQPNNRSGPAKFALTNPGNIILLASQSAMNYLDGGTWGFDKKWFGTVSTNNSLITLDPITGERNLIGNCGMAFSGISFDYTSNTLFGVSWDGFASSLYSINTTNGTTTLIGQCGTDVLINLACDAAGNLYSVGIFSDYLYKLNKSTGTATAVGSIGIDANYQQDMEFDLNTGILYMAAYNSNTSSGEFRTVDKVTGATTLIGAFHGGAEITGFCIPNNAINVGIEERPETVSFVKMFPNPGPGIFTVESSLKNSVIKVTDVLGKIIYSAQLNSGKSQIDLGENPKGVYFYQVKKGSKTLNSGKIVIE